MLTIAQVRTPAEIVRVRDLIREYTAWAFTQSRSASDAPTFAGLEQERATLPGIYTPPSGRLLLATNDGQPAGCVALKGHAASTGEFKRLYTRPGFRG